MGRSEEIAMSIRKHLKLLSDAGAQRAYEQNVPIADVPGELVCGWFDDLYHPESPSIRAAFSARQLEILAGFDALFEAATTELPDPMPRLSSLQKQPAWQRVIAGAAKALRELDEPA